MRLGPVGEKTSLPGQPKALTVFGFVEEIAMITRISSRHGIATSSPDRSRNTNLDCFEYEATPARTVLLAKSPVARQSALPEAVLRVLCDRGR